MARPPDRIGRLADPATTLAELVRIRGMSQRCTILVYRDDHSNVYAVRDDSTAARHHGDDTARVIGWYARGSKTEDIAADLLHERARLLAQRSAA